jgi:transposase
MMDNLSMHKGPDIRGRMDELGFSYTYTPVYSPQYNGIEEVINLGKKLIKDKRLEMILQNK